MTTSDTNNTTHNICADIQAPHSIFLASYLDEELDSAELREFESHTRECPDCFRSLSNAQQVQSSLQEHWKKPLLASPGLHKKLHLAWNEKDKQQKRSVTKNWLAWSLPFAASSLALVALVLFVWTDLQRRHAIQPASVSRSHTGIATVDVAKQHFRERPIFVGTDTHRVAKSAGNYLERPVRAPQFSSTQVRLLGWTPAKLGDGHGATFVYEIKNNTGRFELNVHALKLSDLRLGSQRKLTVSGANLWIDQAMGYNTVTYSNSSSSAYVFSSDMPVDSLVNLVVNTDLVHMLKKAPKTVQ